MERRAPHVVDQDDLSRTMKSLVQQCKDCRPLANDLVALCGWHENSHAVSVAMRPLATRDQPRDEQ